MNTPQELQFAGRLMGRWAKVTAILYPVVAPFTLWLQLKEGGPWLASVMAGLFGPVAISGATFIVAWAVITLAMAFGWQPKK